MAKEKEQGARGHQTPRQRGCLRGSSGFGKEVIAVFLGLPILEL